MLEAKRRDGCPCGWQWFVAACLPVILSAGCGGPPQKVVSQADESVTIELANKAGFKYCNVVSDRFCQSPDSALVFHLPVALMTTTGDNLVSDYVLVSNNGTEEVVIEEYYMTLTDDRGNFYRPVVHGPGDATFSETPMGAFKLEPSGEGRILFRQRIRADARGVTSVSMFYRLQGERDFTQVVVSYRAQNIFEVNK